MVEIPAVVFIFVLFKTFCCPDPNLTLFPPTPILIDPSISLLPPTYKSLVTVDVPTTSKVLTGFSSPIPSLPS